MHGDVDPVTHAGSTSAACRRFREGQVASAEEEVVVEEPLEIRIDGHPFVTTMRTPGNDRELALGLLLGEGWLSGPDDVETLTHGCGGVTPGGDERRASANVVEVRRGEASRRHREPPSARMPATSSCGVCGKRSIEQVLESTPLFAGRTGARGDVEVVRTFSAPTLGTLPERLREAQPLFERTGGLHAAGLFDANGRLLASREDIGRHNAVDKVVGWAFLEGLLPLSSCVLQVSGRASFEIIQKANVAGLPVVSAVSGVSSLAIELAEATGVTLIGFARQGRLTVYSHSARVVQ